MNSKRNSQTPLQLLMCNMKHCDLEVHTSNTESMYIHQQLSIFYDSLTLFSFFVDLLHSTLGFTLRLTVCWLVWHVNCEILKTKIWFYYFLVLNIHKSVSRWKASKTADVN